jgi:MinD-like ATPase involved in chromosome partitioning or flagellar assembly
LISQTIILALKIAKFVKKNQKPCAFSLITMVKYEKWNSNNSDGKKLIRMFKQGRIARSAKPSEIRESDPAFNKYKASSFRGAFYRLRDQYGKKKESENGKEEGIKSGKIIYIY